MYWHCSKHAICEASLAWKYTHGNSQLRARFGIFFFFAACVLAMTSFVIFFLPETNGVPLEEMSAIWTGHWFWAAYVGNRGATFKDIEAMPNAAATADGPP